MTSTRITSIFCISFLAFLCVLPSISSAEEVRVSSTFDKRSVQVNEEVHLNIRISGARGSIQAPRLPAMKAFDTFYTGRASHITFVNNVSTSTLEFSYVLIPKAVGRFTLDPIEVNVEGKLFRTDPIDIEVLGDQGQLQRTAPSGMPQNQPGAQPPMQNAPGGPPQDEPPATFQPDDDNIFVRAWVDKTEVYPNEQILLSYSLYTRYDTRYEGFDEEPQISGFWIEEFPMDREIPRETVRFNGKRYVKADIKKVALFPTTSAQYTIHPGTLKVSIREEPQNTSVFDEFFNDSFFSGGGFFSRRENRLLKPPDISINVKPLPTEGQPQSFDGAVGNFRMESTLDKNSVKQNEPVTMKLVLEGEGNIETLNKPKLPELSAFKVYEANTSSEMFKTGNVIGGRKIFEIVFIPTEAGNLKIPSLEFSFFNPASKRYVSLHTNDFPLNVAPSDKPFELPRNLSQDQLFKKDIEMEGKDIHFIAENLPARNFNSVLKRINPVLFGANILLALAVLWGLMQARQQKIYAKDESLKRRQFAKSIAENRIRSLKKVMGNGTREGSVYFEEVEKILTQFLADKFNMSAYGLTRSELERKLSEVIGSEDPLYRAILDLYALCDESRFARGEVPQDRKNEALKVLRDTIARVEKIRR